MFGLKTKRPKRKKKSAWAPRSRDPVTGLASFSGGHQAGRNIDARQNSPERTKINEAVQDHPIVGGIIDIDHRGTITMQFNTGA